jgi:hypothetical protein
MSFNEWRRLNEAGQWHTIPMSGYEVQITQYSNKGPLIIVKANDQEVTRTYFDFQTGKWNND